MISIVEGYTDGKREWRVYVDQVWIEQFETYDEALSYKMKLLEMQLERASIASDEQPHSVDKDGNIHFNHEK
jgi:hypothetical protein